MPPYVPQDLWYLWFRYLRTYGLMLKGLMVQRMAHMGLCYVTYGPLFFGYGTIVLSLRHLWSCLGELWSMCLWHF